MKKDVVKRSLMFPLMRHHQSKWHTMQVNMDYVCVAYTHHTTLSLISTNTDKTHNDTHSSALSANWRIGSVQGLLFYYSYFPLFTGGKRFGNPPLKVFCHRSTSLSFSHHK